MSQNEILLFYFTVTIIVVFLLIRANAIIEKLKKELNEIYEFCINIIQEEEDEEDDEE